MMDEYDGPMSGILDDLWAAARVKIAEVVAKKTGFVVASQAIAAGKPLSAIWEAVRKQGTEAAKAAVEQMTPEKMRERTAAQIAARAGVNPELIRQVGLEVGPTPMRLALYTGAGVAGLAVIGGTLFLLLRR